MVTKVKILIGKVALVTGGTSGVGRETAYGLAREGADLILVGRDVRKGRELVEDLYDDTGVRADFVPADLSLLREVRRVAAYIRDQYDRLDLLIHSAWVINFEKLLTDEGIEQTFATDYLSRFYLTDLLLDLLHAASSARIVIVGAPNKWTRSRLDFANLNSEQGFNPLRTLSTAQFANDLFTAELARRLEGTTVTINNVNPGFVRSDALRNAPQWVQWASNVVSLFFGRDPRDGAETPLHVATTPVLNGVNGQFFYDFVPTQPSRAAYDRDLAQQLWEYSEGIIANDGISSIKHSLVTA